MTEEYTKTPGGFCKLELDLDEDSVNRLMELWTEQSLHPASLELYNEIKETEGQEVALYRAILNDQLIEALTAAINDAEATKDI